MPKKSAHPVRRRLTKPKRRPRPKPNDSETVKVTDDTEEDLACESNADGVVKDEGIIADTDATEKDFTCESNSDRILTDEGLVGEVTPGSSTSLMGAQSEIAHMTDEGLVGEVTAGSSISLMGAQSEVPSPGSSIDAESLDENLLSDACAYLHGFLRESWICHVSNGGIHVMLLSRKKEKAVQRRLFFAADGEVELSVHCAPLQLQNYMKDVPNRIVLNSITMKSFVDRCVKIVDAIRQLEICSGVADEEFRNVWSLVSSATVDKNPYQENRFSETLRSVDCERLVSVRKWQCGKCRVLRNTVRKRAEFFSKDVVHPSTPNLVLSEAQRLCKLEEQRKKIHMYATRLERLEEKMQKLLDAQGVKVSKDVHQDLMDILNGCDLNPTHAFFLQQQLKAASCKGASGVRWHPSMIRYALALHVASPAAYKTARDSGMIKLPSQRTLFDYSHFTEAKEGIHNAVLKNVSERIAKMPHSYQKYHVLMCDEIHICQNLVFKKSTGEMLGYVKLSDADADVAVLQAFLEKGEPTTVQPILAKKMLSFLIKGTASNIKEVVASYSVDRLTAEFLYSTTWNVIIRCERAGIAIVVFVSDAYAANRAFMRKHKPVGVTKSGIIYSTIYRLHRTDCCTSCPTLPIF